MKQIAPILLSLLLLALPGRAEDILQVAPFDAEAGTVSQDNRYMSLELRNTRPVYVLQFDLYLPEGLRLDADALVLNDARCPYETDRQGNKKYYQLTAYRDFGEGHYRVLLYASVELGKTMPLHGESGEVMKLYYVTDAAMKPGVYPVICRKQIIGYSGTEGARLEEAASYVRVGGATLSEGAHADLSGLAGTWPSFVAEGIGQQLAANAGLRSVDLAGADALNADLALPHPNVLRFVKAGSPYARQLAEAGVGNVAQADEAGGYSSQRLLLDEDYPFGSPKAVQAASVTLRRSGLSEGWNTLCLPFGLAPEALQAAFGAEARAETFAEVAGDELRFSPAADGLRAHQPALLHVPAANAAASYELGPALIEPDDGTPETLIGEAAFRGNYGGTASAEGLYGIAPDDRLMRGGVNARLKGFRAAFSLGFDEARNNRLVLVHDPATTGIATPAAAPRLVDVYTLDGRLVRRSVAAGEARRGLAKGIYLIGNVKTIID